MHYICVIFTVTQASMPCITGDTFKRVLRGEKCPLLVCVCMCFPYICTHIRAILPSLLHFPSLYLVAPPPLLSPIIAHSSLILISGSYLSASSKMQLMCF